MSKTYLGDGAYADFDGYQVILTAENGIEATDTVALEPGALQSFFRYLENLYDMKITTTKNIVGEE